MQIIHALAEDTTGVRLISKADYLCSSRGYNSSTADIQSRLFMLYSRGYITKLYNVQFSNYSTKKLKNIAGLMSTAGNSVTTVVKATAPQVRCPQQATPLLLQ
jgi:hypothetical protein